MLVASTETYFLLLRLVSIYSGFPQIRNHFFMYSLMFSNNSLLFYQLFYMKIEICFLYKGVSHSREPAVVITIAEYVCAKKILKLSTHRLQIFLLKDRYLSSLRCIDQAISIVRSMGFGRVLFQ